ARPDAGERAPPQGVSDEIVVRSLRGHALDELFGVLIPQQLYDLCEQRPVGRCRRGGPDRLERRRRGAKLPLGGGDLSREQLDLRPDERLCGAAEAQAELLIGGSRIPEQAASLVEVATQREEAGETRVSRASQLAVEPELVGEAV